MASDSDRKPFLGDTATRGSQTEPQINEGPDGIPVMTAANTSMVTRSNENKKRPWGGKQPVRSRLLDKESPISIPNRSPKKRRTTPYSNWEFNPAPLRPIPREFDLSEFAFTPLPDPHQDYERFNNDLVIERYKPSIRSYSGTQRKGICEPFPNADSYTENISETPQATFPLGEKTPLPMDLETALNFHHDNSRETIREFQRSQIKALRTIAQECQEETNRWYKFTPDKLQNTTGTIHIALLAHLTRFTRIKGTNWLMQFIVGFPITGELQQKSGISPQKGGGLRTAIA